ncbi:MAG: hypothetical protein PHW33_05080, partial [Candidatus Portnoybacteria bacterium]|nr:hypothetical protein [Candidatus Portnoybacteria bacterium]
MKILAIETSCDDTGIAVLEVLPNGRQRLLANLVSSQIKVHAPWGGVVPSLAAREHQRNLLPLLIKALSESKLLKTSQSQIPIAKQIQKSKLKNLEKILEREPELAKQLIPFLKKYPKPPVDCLAVTAGPGLEPALWAGVNLARALACFWRLPIIPANHIKGHLLAALAEKKSAKNYFPAIGLVVSGGHTQLVLIRI